MWSGLRLQWQSSTPSPMSDTTQYTIMPRIFVKGIATANSRNANSKMSTLHTPGGRIHALLPDILPVWSLGDDHDHPILIDIQPQPLQPVSDCPSNLDGSHL